ncbi:MAG: hypothetical protein WCW16_05615 [Candidatus Magasanikbacteria bacterium]
MSGKRQRAKSPEKKTASRRGLHSRGKIPRMNEEDRNWFKIALTILGFAILVIGVIAVSSSLHGCAIEGAEWQDGPSDADAVEVDIEVTTVSDVLDQVCLDDVCAVGDHRCAGLPCPCSEGCLPGWHCGAAGHCLVGEQTPTDESLHCTDGLDNDSDGRIDCRDPDCGWVDGCPIERDICSEQIENPNPQPVGTCCGNGEDDDADGLADCDDPDCGGVDDCPGAIWCRDDEQCGAMVVPPCSYGGCGPYGRCELGILPPGFLCDTDGVAGNECCGENGQCVLISP